MGGDFGCVRFGRFTRRKRYSIFLPCTMSDEDRMKLAAREHPNRTQPLKTYRAIRLQWMKGMRHAARRCTPPSSLAWLSRLQRRARHVAQNLFACKNTGRREGGEILFRPRSSCDDPSKRKEKKRRKKKGWGNAEATTLCGVWEQSAKSIGSHSKDDRAIDAHHELHTNIGVH